MGAARRDARHDVMSGGQSPILLDLRNLRPLEIVLIRRYVHDMPLDGFPAIDRLAVELERQLESLPHVDLPFAREVYETFAMSPYPADRLNIGLLLRPLTLADHDTGFSLWHRLVRDENPTVRRDVYHPIHQHLTADGGIAEVALSVEGLTLADAHTLRDAFIGAQYLGGCHIIAETPVATALQEATHSLESIAHV